MRPIAVDIHVVEGRSQGSRTVLINLLRAVSRIGEAARFRLYCSDVELCRQAIAADGFTYGQIAHGGSFKRLLATLPKAYRRDGAPAAVWQYISSPFFGGGSVVVIHDILPFTHPKLFPLAFRIRCQVLFLLSMMRADVIIAVSDTARQEIGRRFPALAPKVALVPNGPSFDEAVYFAAPKPEPAWPRPYVFTVGRIEGRKNIDMLARAFVKAGLGDIDLVIVGKRDLGFDAPFPDSPRIHLLDYVDEARLIDLYRGAALYAYPSSAEGFGIPLLDAVLFGVPTLSSDQTSMPEVAGGMAALFDPTRPDAEEVLAAAIKSHFQDKPIPRPSPDQRSAHLARFSWDSSARSFVKAMERLKTA